MMLVLMFWLIGFSVVLILWYTDFLNATNHELWGRSFPLDFSYHKLNAFICDFLIPVTNYTVRIHRYIWHSSFDHSLPLYLFIFFYWSFNFYLSKLSRKIVRAVTLCSPTSAGSIFFPQYRGKTATWGISSLFSIHHRSDKE